MRKRSWLLITLYALGWWLGGLHPMMEQVYGFWPLFGVWLALLGWLGSLVGWGVWWSRRLRLEGVGFAEFAALGAASMALSAAGLGALGLIGPSFAWAFHLIVILGILFVGEIPPFLDPLDLLKLRRGEPLALAALFGVFLVVVLMASRIHFIQDVMTIHLYGPEYWWRQGKIAAVAQHPFVFQTGVWDALNFYGLALFSRSPGLGLVSTQFFSQALQSTLATGGFALVLYRISGYCLRERAWAYLIIVVALVYEPLLWTSWMGKHDFGAIFWGFIAFLFLLPVSSPKSRAILAGFFLGLAVASKVTLGPWALGLGIAWFICRAIHLGGTGAFKGLVELLIGGGLGLALQWIRNLWFTGIPFFPLEILGWLSPVIAETHRELLNGTFPGNPLPPYNAWGEAAQQILFSYPDWIIGALLGLIVWVRYPRTNIGFVALVAFLTSVIYVLLLGGRLTAAHSLRLVAPALIISRLVFVAAIANLLYRMPVGTRPFLAWVRVGALVLWIAFSFVPWPALWMPKPDPALAISEQMRAGQCKLWLNHNASVKTKILFINDDLLYFTTGDLISSGFHDPKVDPILRSGEAPAKIFADIRHQGFRYLMDDFGSATTNFYAQLNTWRGWLTPQSQALAFRGKDCVVLDLEKLTK